MSPAGLHSQNIALSGIITDASDGRPVPGANIILLDESGEQVRGSVTDNDGVFRIRNITRGEYQVRVSYVGYATLLETVLLDGSETSVAFSRSIEIDSGTLGEVVVSVPSQSGRVVGGHQRVSAADLTRAVTPAAGGDMATYLQVLPGVVAAGDRGGQLFVRGGTPSENMALIDGLLIYQPFHIVGFFSAFPENLLANADFYAGGFSPRYNGRISSVLDVQMRDGNFQETKASASLSPFLAEIQMEGPISEGSASWLGSVRSSQIERTSELLLGEQQPLRFESQFLKFSQLSDDGTRCSAMAMRTYDRGKLDFEMGNSFKWTNFVIGGKCTHLAQDPDIYIDLNVGLSHLSNSLGGSQETNLSSGLTKFSSELDMTQDVGNIRMNYGVYSHMKWISYDIEEIFQIPEAESEILLGVGGYAEATIPLGDRVKIRPGSAFSFYTSIYSPSIEPRVRFSWQPFGSDRHELNASVGVYRQAIAGITDLRDAGSAFIAWLPTPNEQRMEAIHTLVGWQQQFRNGLQISAEAYHKNLRNLPVTVWSTIAEFTTDIAFANGDVYGLDLRLEYGSRRFYGFLGYGLSWTEYTSAQDNFTEWFGTSVQSYHPAHDRRHQVNSMVSLDVGNFTFGLNWQMGTGLPYTRQMGFDGILPFDDGLPNIRTRYGTPRVILDRPFEGRTPAYHRLDVSVEREFNLSFATLDLQIGAINTYGRKNLFYYDVFTQRRIDQLPLAPYASVKMEL